MSEFADALEGAVGLIAGGIVLLLFASTLGRVGLIDLSMWGAIYIVVGVIALTTLVTAALAALIEGKR